MSSRVVFSRPQRQRSIRQMALLLGILLATAWPRPSIAADVTFTANTFSDVSRYDFRTVGPPSDYDTGHAPITFDAECQGSACDAEDQYSIVYLRFSTSSLCFGVKPLSVSSATIGFYSKVNNDDEGADVSMWDISLLQYPDVPALDDAQFDRDTLPLDVPSATLLHVDTMAELTPASNADAWSETAPITSLVQYYYNDLNPGDGDYIGFAIEIEAAETGIFVNYDYHSYDSVGLQPELLLSVTCPPIPPDPPANPTARLSVSGALINPNDWIGQSFVVLEADASDPEPSETLKLQFQLQPVGDSYGGFPATFAAAGSDCAGR